MADDVNRTDEPEVEGHLKAAEPVEKKAARPDDGPEVEGHRMSLGSEKAADPEKTRDKA